MQKRTFRITIAILVTIGLLSLIFAGFSSAVSIKLHDGTEINLQGLSDTEKANMIKYVEKMNDEAGSTLTQSATDVLISSAKDPAKLNEWRQLITGTIKDIANDLNVSVNEFVKTPVGLGVAALIFYKVAGKDMMATIFDVMFAIPFWCMIMIVCVLTARAFLGYKTEMMIITSKPSLLTDSKLREDVEEVVTGNEKVKIERPIRVCRYDWRSNDSRQVFGCFMIGIPIVVTIACFIVVFVN